MIAAACLLLINLATFAAFGLDKRAAVRGGRRVSERTLLALAAAGGTPAAFAGRLMFRHKTRKQPFVAWLWFIAALQVFAAIAVMLLGN